MVLSRFQKVDRLPVSHTERQAKFVFGRYKTEQSVEYWNTEGWTSTISDAVVFPDALLVLAESIEILKREPQEGYFVQPFPVRVRAVR